jgi:putative protease
VKQTKIELLAPAGTKEAFVGAINAGANAIYLSGKNYGARKYANNFTKEEIVDLIEYAHLRNVKVYVTVNTLIFEDEIDDLFDYCDYLVINNVDALIVQDLGIIDAFCRRYPDTEIHASTQMNVYNEYQLKFLADLGVKRVILARETSTDDIKKMLENIKIDVEVFVHGALCVSYSGNCLFSSFKGGRSGNRGECAQPCRLKYSLYRENDLVEADSYLLSTKDLLTIKELDKVISSGVKSLKIEGRMRKHEYVIATVRAYREAIDNILENKPFDLEKRIKELLSVFNREYTKGYLLDEEPFKINNSNRPNHQGIEVGKVINYNRGKTTIKLTDDLRVGDGIRIIGSLDQGGQVGRIFINNNLVKEAKAKDVIIIDLPKKVEVGDKVLKTSDSFLEASLNNYLDESYGIVPIDIKLYSYIGNELKIEIKSDNTNSITIKSDYIVVPAKKAIQDEEKLASQFNKFGNTCFKVERLEVLTDGLGFIPNGVLNELKREGIKALEEVLLNREPKRVIKSSLQISNNVIIDSEPRLFVKVENEEQYQAALKCNIKDIASYMTRKSWPIDPKTNNYLMLNRIWYELTNKNTFDSYVIRDFGSLSLAKENEVIADSTVNATNSLTLETLFNNSVQRVCLSLESGIENTKNMIQSFKQRHGSIPNLEMVVYGKVDLMISKYCPITKSEGVFKQNCMMCEKNDYALVNEKNERFSLVREGYCNLRILNSKVINLIDYIPDILSSGVKTIRLDFTKETPEEVEMVIKAYQNKMMGNDYVMPANYYSYGRFLR